MNKLGYKVEYCESNNYLTASAIFYNKILFKSLELHQIFYDEEGPEFLMYAVFNLKSD